MAVMRQLKQADGVGATGSQITLPLSRALGAWANQRMQLEGR